MFRSLGGSERCTLLRCSRRPRHQRGRPQRARYRNQRCTFVLLAGLKRIKVRYTSLTRSAHVLTGQFIDACNGHQHRLHPPITPRERSWLWRLSSIWTSSFHAAGGVASSWSFLHSLPYFCGLLHNVCPCIPIGVSRMA